MPRQFRNSFVRVGLAALLSSNVLAADDVPLQVRAYLDVGYVGSNRDPSDDNWQGKSSAATLNQLELNEAMFNLSREANVGSRWGFEFGLQAGDDSKRLVTSSPPAANEPIGNADDWRHLYRANVSYLFGTDGKVRLTTGLINSYIGYESYLSIDNPNYTRAYLSDTVPYFLFGGELRWDVSDSVDLGFYLVNGYNYLTDPNDIPSLGFSAGFSLSDNTKFIQNLYYGSDQDNTDLEYWRFFSNSIVEWQRGPWRLAASLDYGTEKQADQPGQPRFQWTTGAVWLVWAANERLSFAVRPEFHLDDDGLVTGGQQRLLGLTGTAKYQVLRGSQRLVGTLEARHDRSSGDAGFADEPDDVLRTTQTLVVLGINWEFAG